MQRILLATDLSGTSRAAEAFATQLANAFGAVLLVVYVTPGQPTEHLGPQYRGLQDPEIPEVARRLATIKPASGIACNLTKQERFDLVVLGTHARSIAKRLMLGNVAERGLTYAAPLRSLDGTLDRERTFIRHGCAAGPFARPPRRSVVT
jgi:nucleotide-binding universal stress UspA family protein